MNEEERITLLEYLFDPLTMKILTHLWVAQDFDYDKQWMADHHKCSLQELEKALNKLTPMGLVEVIRPRGKPMTFQYGKNVVAKNFSNFMIHLCIVNLEGQAGFTP